MLMSPAGHMAGPGGLVFIYGGPRSGRTCLLHALGNYARQLHPSLDVRYVDAAEFGSESAIAAQDAGMLLVGDIELLPATRDIQAGFLCVFNALHDAGKQLVISSDRAPGSLANLDGGVRDRLGWGLLTEVEPPELETRIAILRSKMIREGFTVPPEVLEYIASWNPADIRELESALIRVTTFASRSHQSVDLQLAETVLKDLFPEA
jgi:chromosomal replication initiator protein